MNFYEPDILASAKLVAGEEAVVEGATRVAGVVPKLYVTPPDVETLSATVKWANDAGQTIVPVGGGTKMERLKKSFSQYHILMMMVKKRLYLESLII